MPNWRKIEQEVSLALDADFTLEQQYAVTGGDINQAMRLEGLLDGELKSFFIKLNKQNLLPMFQAEAEGLIELKQANAIKVPNVVCVGEAENSYIVLEHLNFTDGDESLARKLGQQLALLHRTVSMDGAYGWHQNNTIGSTQQINTKSSNWVDFWREQRLGSQLALAKENGASRNLLDKGKQLQKNLEFLFEDYTAEASLLHGDLWSGNYAYVNNNEPVIFDPAIYYGDRESDIAMTELFGGFSSEFYQAYNDEWPLDEGYNIRKNLYNLYHILNHYNLFGGGYGVQAENMIDSLLKNI